MHRSLKMRIPWAKRELYVDIDKALVPVIATLWRCGIPTVHCCQGEADGPLAYICFLEQADAERFIRAAGIESLIVEPNSHNTVRFRHADISRIAQELVRKAWLGLATPKVRKSKAERRELKFAEMRARQQQSKIRKRKPKSLGPRSPGR